MSLVTETNLSSEFPIRSDTITEDCLRFEMSDLGSRGTVLCFRIHAKSRYMYSHDAALITIHRRYMVRQHKSEPFSGSSLESILLQDSQQERPE